MNNLIEGLSGTGKTTIGKELHERGFRVIEADEVFGYYGDPETGVPTNDKSQLNWLWDKTKVDKELTADPERVTFVCGGAMNQGEFTKYFTNIFTLFLDDETLKDRLLDRTNNDFGKDPKDLRKQLEWNKGTISYAKQRNTILIDATRPVDVVVDDILSYIIDKQ